ncbi:4-(cytidine 5'-diphospho)-2-C-methyl-D-erythritol kinase [Brevundimonas naejangsanensis]|uniref:4-diphosphocytidyl-2-C-methyl-D-erythritol kinase n=1 Tax=Brevundimonas naejangsanensis TaxID=588932 RepID=A0A494RF70_9CAUL|nr:4-(cytidine 5'-diphospho)-2-C-methyl-D-erythritol kinase [Brevundimonas naejangsanensis]AYG94069.1 4-(cytidine 5'-diphospho)-2-C-methyl-D-erythritol kinase [Brevundimonas naejangsanensis]
MTDVLTGLAPAKINLLLHVGPVRADGYHPLVSLAAFADVGDRVAVRRAEALSLAVEGPFAAGLDGQGDNLILKALRALGEAAGIGDPPLAVTLDKRLPIAAGLGGGSADAGTALRLAARLLDLDLTEAALERLALAAGADGPMCLRARPAWASGVGEVLEDEPRLPPLHAVLLNPGLPSPTGAVYRAYDAAPDGAADRPAPPADWSAPAVIDWLSAQRNDLQAPALTLTPGIDEALAAMQAAPGCRLTRMSGSGATVFGLFDDRAAAIEAVFALDRPGWWTRPAVLGAPDVEPRAVI